MKMYPFDTIIKLTVLYGVEVRGLYMSFIDWACVKRVHSVMFQGMICCKQTVPQAIVQAEFGAYPLVLENICKLVFFLCKIYNLGDFAFGLVRYLYLALCSFKEIAHSPLKERSIGLLGITSIEHTFRVHGFWP